MPPSLPATIPGNVVQPNQTNYRVSQISNSRDPSELPTALSLSFDFSAAASYPIDVTTLFRSGRITNLQTLYMDNSQNGELVTVTVGGSGQTLEIPARACAYLPILLPMQGTLTFACANGTGIANVNLLNVPMPTIVWFPFSDLSNGSIGTDHSANAPALLANLLLTIAKNLDRKGGFIQNQSANQMQVVIDDGATGTPTIYLLAANSGGANKPGDGFDLTGTTGRVRVFSSAVGDQVAAREI